MYRHRWIDGYTDRIILYSPCVKQEEAPVISSQYRLSAVVSHVGSHLFFGKTFYPSHSFIQ